jgi:hypothetical protein
MPLAEVVVATLVGKLLGKAADTISDLRKESHADRVLIDDSRARVNLISHLQTVDSWSNSIALLSLLRNKSLRDSFVDLSLDVGLSRYGRRSERSVVKLPDIFADSNHIAILGRPGAGKTTSLQKIAQISIAEWENNASRVPVLVRLRDLRNGETLLTHVLAMLGISVGVPERVAPEISDAWRHRTALSYLESISALLLVDGLDETNSLVRSQIETELRDLVLMPGGHRVIVTCRTADFRVQLPNTQIYTIRPLSSSQVAEFATRWLGSVSASKFLQAVARNPYSGTEVVPLTLAHLCAIYERDGALPPRPIDVYEQIVSLLVEEWDRQRGVYRYSHYADFSWRKKERFLQAVAYELAIRGRKGSFREDDLERVYHEVAPAFNLPTDEATMVIHEIESHTGLVHESGYRQYDFVHLSIQEFLTAMHAHRKLDATKQLIPKFPNEMALVVAYSTEPEGYLEQVLTETLKYLAAGVAVDFIIPLLSRLAIERPLWSLDLRLGWTFAAFLDIVTRHLLRTDKQARLLMPPEVTRFFRQREVSQAVAWVIADAEYYSIDRAHRLIPKSHASLPPSLSDYLKNAKDAGLLFLQGEKVVEDILSKKRKSIVTTKRSRRR